ncbi:Importin-beta N-terminal domain containing protein [Histomonas meleagridis]|uniref:Importin-beta N-terminal domain containing protein n=1 Tax=Histomonas meleagridis TaxID=135588 RepID=UPI003559F7B7|nr:Importin-beta N-terminal domain containing protein [Histomonas meleagridis]KAH0798893.1 Importin-beta N-terminal domain containing protein [Histomonas meleagridis]
MPSQELIPFATDFSNSILPLISQLFQQSDSLELNSLGFSCASRILQSTNIPIDFPSLIPLFLPILQKSFSISNVSSENPELYLNFSYRALKFSIALVTKYWQQIDFETVNNYIQLIQGLLRANVPPKYKCLLLQLLSKITELEQSWSIIEPNLPFFLKDMMAPLFALSQEEIQMVESDPAMFISEVHKSGDEFEDVRTAAASIIYSLAKDHEDVTNVSRLVAAEAFVWYSNLQKDISAQAILFSTFLMFSTVSKFLSDSNPQLLSNFFTSAGVLFQIPDNLPRAAIFMLLSSVSSTFAMSNIPEVITICIQHLMDPSPLVRYYSAISASNLLEKFNDAKAIRNAFLPSLQALFQSIFQLSTIFHHRDLAQAITALVKVFSSDVKQIADGLGHELLCLLANSSESEETAGDLIDSFEFLIDVIVKSDTAQTVGSVLFLKSIELLKLLKNSRIFDLFAMSVKRLLENCHFEESFWNAAPIIIERIQTDNDISITDLCEIISLLVYKDNDFGKKQELSSTLTQFIVQQLRNSMNDFDVWNEYAKVISSIMLRLTAQSELVGGIFPDVTQMTCTQIEFSIQNPFFECIGLDTIVNVLLIVNAAAVNSICGAKFEWFINYWIENPKFPETAVSAITCFPMFSGNASYQTKILVTLAELLCTDVFNRDPMHDNFDQVADCETNVIWFDYPQTLNAVYQLFVGAQTNGSVYQSFVQQIPQEWLAMLEKTPQFAELYVRGSIQGM